MGGEAGGFTTCTFTFAITPYTKTLNVGIRTSYLAYGLMLTANYMLTVSLPIISSVYSSQYSRPIVNKYPTNVDGTTVGNNLFYCLSGISIRQVVVLYGTNPVLSTPLLINPPYQFCHSNLILQR